jgi:hypothetical protein
MALQSLILPILSVFRSAGLQQASGVLRKLTGDVDSLAGKLGLAAGSFSAFSALTSARQFTIDSVNATAQFERNLLGLQQVFEGITPQIRSFVREVEDYGLSQAQAAQASVFLGSVLKQYGFSVTETAGQTERLVTLAQDLATTYGYDVQEALLAITALFRGEYDPIEKFGVAMKQNEVNARLAAQGLNDLEGAELANAQAIARLDMLFERADDSIGAFTRASDTLYASQQRLNAIMGNLQVAFGTPLQKPLAEINNLFADLAQEYGPELAEIGQAIGGAIGALTPILGVLGNTILQLLQPLQQIIDLLSFVVTIATGAFSPALVVLNGLLDTFNGILDLGTSLLGLFGNAMSDTTDDANSFKVFLESLGIDPDKENSLESYARRLESMAMAVDRAKGQTDVFSASVHMADLAMVSAATEATNLANKGKTIEDAFKSVATGAVDAEGKLSGLAGVFQRIEDAAAQSTAKQAMEELGLSAGFIEEVLKRPNWKEIFQMIATYARLAAIEVSSIFDRTGESIRFIAELENQKGTLLERINKAFAAASKNTGGTKQAAKDSVKDFFDTMGDEIQKQTIRNQLKLRGASDGLVDAILGSGAWMKLWQEIKRGTLSLEELQKQFNKTAAGIEEQSVAYDEALRKQQEYDAAVRQINERLQDELTRIREKADAARLAVSDMLEGFVVLPTLEREIGRFESQVTQMLASIESSLRSAFRNKDILEKGYNSLQEYARRELSTLQDIGRQRDEFAQRYDLAQGIIDNYKKAFTAAISLTQLFSSLKDETEKRTVTEVTKGVVKLGSALREFGVTVSRSYEETIVKVQDKTQGIITGFQDIANKARTFAENLRTLRQMGLDPMLFDQLVQAGVVAGGETAQALVDGGSDTINEINTLFQEIDSLGAGLGEEVAASLYGSGVNMMDGLLEGIRSKQNELEATARTLAEAFNKEFQSKFDIQVKIASDAAEKAARATARKEIKGLGPRPELPPLVDTAALAKLDSLIAGANKYIGSVADPLKAAGGTVKLDIYKDLRSAIAAGAAVDLSGVRSGLSTAELAAAARATGAVTNNYDITVTADSRLGGAKAGEAIVASLEKFSQTNGNFTVGLTV